MNSDSLRTAILDSLRDIAPEADLERLADTTGLRDTLDLDSMDFLNFVIGIHERTGIDVPERDYHLLSTVGGALAYLEQHSSAVR